MSCRVSRMRARRVPIYTMSAMVSLSALLPAGAAIAQAYSTGSGPYAQPYLQGPTRPFDGSSRAGVYTARPAPRYDIPQRPDYAAPKPIVPPAIWNGLYLGAQAGYRYSVAAIDGWNAPAMRAGGLQRGGQLGYNLQWKSLVVGVEGDLMLGSQTATSSVPGATLTMRDAWASTVRGRGGVAFGQALIYGTGGIAVAQRSVAVTSQPLAASLSETRLGYVYGGGIEFKLAPQLSTRVEALHYSYQGSGVNWNSGTSGVKQDSNVVRGGISFHFN